MSEQSGLRDVEIKLTTGMILSVWWLIWWRTVVLLFVGGVVVVLIFAKVGTLLGVDNPEDLADSANYIFASFWAPFVSVWVLHMAFRKRYARTGFRIALVPLDETKSKIGAASLD